MPEYIDREDAIKELQKRLIEEHKCGFAFIDSDFIDFLNDLPTEDVVPVVRCKDCKYSTERQGFENRMWNDDCVMCDHIAMGHRIPMNINDYCSYGERKD